MSVLERLKSGFCDGEVMPSEIRMDRETALSLISEHEALLAERDRYKAALSHIANKAQLSVKYSDIQDQVFWQHATFEAMDDAQKALKPLPTPDEGL